MTINKKIAVLINNPSDLDYLESKFSNNSTFIARNYITNYKTGSKVISYFKILDNGHGENYNIVLHMALNWFRDHSGNDLSINKGISIGNIIAKRILSNSYGVCRYCVKYGTSKEYTFTEGTNLVI